MVRGRSVLHTCKDLRIQGVEGHGWDFQMLQDGMWVKSGGSQDFLSGDKCES